MTARAIPISVVAALGLLASLALPASAPAKSSISGRLSKPGYTVIALESNGKANSVRAGRGAFKLRLPGRHVRLATLELRAPDGVYAGPVVIGSEQHGRRAILGVRPGAKLGKIKINVAKGYAKVKGRPRKAALATERFARARKGVPIGNGLNVGRVRSPGGSLPGDLDLDGVPDVIDIDDDGDLVLDNFDPSKKTKQKKSKKGRAAAFHPSGDFLLFSDLETDLSGVANANAPGLSDAQINAALMTNGELKMEILPPYTAELDCAQPQSRSDPTLGGLVYCSKGGTGTLPQYGSMAPPSSWPHFPDCCDPDGDGFGTMVDQAPLPGEHGMFLRHGANSSQIGTGDLLIQRISSGGSETDYLATLQYVFATTPALVSYSDGQGHSAAVSYPVAPGAPGTQGNGFPVAAGPSGDVMVTLTFWRPQRRPIPPEAGAWIDIGGLKYGAVVAFMDPGQFTCEHSAYSTSDPNLTPDDPTPQPGGGGFRDLAGDTPAIPSDTFTFTLDLTQCLGSKGFSFNPGEERGIGLRGVTPQPNSDDQAAVSFFFKRL
jgi:hypothetical protein